MRTPTQIDPAPGGVLPRPASDRPARRSDRAPARKRDEEALSAARRRMHDELSKLQAMLVAGRPLRDSEWRDLAPALPLMPAEIGANGFPGPTPAPATARPELAPHEAAVVAAALAILDARLRAPGGDLSRSDAVRHFLRLHLSERRREAFAVLFLDTLHRAIAFEVMFEGTLSQTMVYPREVVRRALEHGAAAVILAHNHPSGAAEPSSADEFLTQALKAALSLVDVRVIDHFVIAGADAVSFAERGLL